MAKEKRSPVNLMLLSEEEELGRILEAELCAEERVDNGITRINGVLVCTERVAGTPESNPAWKEHLASGTAAVLALRHIDMVSLEAARKIHAALEESFAHLPFGVLIMREDGETDFKMSCVYCGQKLWVQDGDVDKRGRCPSCKKAFTLPAQTRLLRLHLKVPDSTPVSIVYQDNPYTSRGAVGNLIGALEGGIVDALERFDPENIKKSTVRVQISDNDTDDAG